MIIRIPGLGAVAVTRDKGSASIIGSQVFATNLKADHYRRGRLYERYDLGSGMVTNVGVMAMANDFAWSAQLNLSTLGTQNFHAVGTGTNVEALTDIALQTLSAPTTTTAVTGVQTLLSVANSQKYQTVATTAFTTTLAIVEWGLHSSATLSASTGTPFTSGTATTGVSTGTTLTASSATVRGNQQFIVKDTTNGTPFYGLVTANSTSTFTVPAWYKVSDGTLSASNPANADAYVILPVMFDRRHFAAINVVNTDSIVWTYQLTITPGG